MVEVLSHFLGFFIGFTLTLGIIGSILYYIKPDSRKSTYFIWDFIFGIITTLVILLTLIIISQ